MSRDLESRYSRLLILLPKHYRLARGEEMLAVYMAGAEGEGRNRRWPDPREVLSLTALAVRTRVGTEAGRRRAKTGGLARLTALTTVFWLAFVGLDQATQMLRMYHRLTEEGRGVHDPVMVLHRLGQGLWLVVLIALAVGLRRLGGALAVGLGGLTLLTEGGATAVVRDAPFMVVAAAASHLAARRPASRGRGQGWSRGWSRGWLAASGLLTAFGVYWLAAPYAALDVMSPALGFDALPVESVVGLAVASCLWNRRSTAWLLAIAVAGGLAVFEFGGGFLPGGQRPAPPAEILLAALEAGLVVVLAVRLAGRRRRSRGDGTPSPA